MKHTDDAQFWNQFAKNFWEQKSILVKNFKSSISEIDETTIFRMLVAYGNRCRKLKSADGFKLYIDGHIVHPSETLQFLPVKSDKSLRGYHTRMEEYYPDYCLVCDELLQVSESNWKLLQDFTDNLFSYVGLPNRFVEMGLYLGNYRKTPFGVHVDGCGVFSFPVIGEKTFRIWKPEFALKNPALDRSLSYARFNKHSSVMQASAGDMTYWPSSAWHIAESKGQFSATWSLGVWVDRPHREVASSAFARLLTSKLGVEGEKTSTQLEPLSQDGQITALPKDFRTTIEQIRNITDAELHDLFLSDWTAHLSKRGFKNGPKASAHPPKILITSLIKLPTTDTILWATKTSEAKNIYAYRGTTVEAPKSSNLKKLVAALNNHQECKISDYLKGANKTQDLKLLQQLLAAIH